MRDVLTELTRWWRDGQPVGMATVVGTWRSAPRPAGATMLVGADGTAVGSVSGGCVEGAVYELCREAIETGNPVLQRYGISDDDAFAVGLTCGGIIDLFVERVDQRASPSWATWPRPSRPGEPVAVATCIEGPADRLGQRLVIWPDRRSGSPRLGPARRRRHRRRPRPAGRRPHRHPPLWTRRRAARRRAGALRGQPRAAAAHAGVRRHRLRRRGGPGRRLPRLPGHRLRRAARLRHAQALPRRRRGRRRLAPPLPAPARSTQGRVDERTVVCVLTHDPKFDVPVLEVALRQPFAYVGAMGSRRTHDDRMKRLREAGVEEERWPGSPRRSGLTSAPGRRRRRRSASPPRSSPAGGAAAAPA